MHINGINSILKLQSVKGEETKLDEETPSSDG